MPEPKQINQNIDSQILRARWHDYRDEGYYMVTNERAAAFGQLVGDSEESAVITLSSLGLALEKAIADIPVYYPWADRTHTKPRCTDSC